MPKSLSKALFLGALSSVLCLYSFAQKLPESQEISVLAPNNVKIDGRAGEWNNRLQAHNRSTDIDYTIGNDKANLYIVIQSKDAVIAKKILAGGITVRINAGGSALATSLGSFSADQYYSPSSISSTSARIAGARSQALYQTERFSIDGLLSYAIPVSNGTYSVVLHFAEIYWTQPGQRVFYVSLEGKQVLDDYDIVGKVGALTATTETFSVTVSDGVLNLDFSALASEGGRDQAKVSAIEVLPLAAISQVVAPADMRISPNPSSTVLEGLSLYPNPATDRVTLSCQVATSQRATCTLTDALGRLVRQQDLSLQAGYNSVAVPIGQAAPGIYQFTLRLADGQHQQQKLVLQP